MSAQLSPSTTATVGSLPPPVLLQLDGHVIIRCIAQGAYACLQQVALGRELEQVVFGAGTGNIHVDLLSNLHMHTAVMCMASVDACVCRRKQTQSIWHLLSVCPVCFVIHASHPCLQGGVGQQRCACISNNHGCMMAVRLPCVPCSTHCVCWDPCCCCCCRCRQPHLVAIHFG